MNMIFLRIVFTFSFFLFTLGCTTPAYFALPSTSLKSPTVPGETLEGRVGLAVSPPVFVVTVKNINTTPPEDSGSEITRDPEESFDLNDPFTPLWLDFGLGLGSRFEIGRTQGNNHIKWQFMGSPRTAAKANQWVGSVVFEALSGSKGVDLDTDSSDNDAEIQYRGSGYELIVGYRYNEESMVYVNLGQFNFSAETEVDQSGTIFTYDDDGHQSHAILGVRREDKDNGFYSALEWSYTKTKWAELDEVELGAGGFLIGFAW